MNLAICDNVGGPRGYMLSEISPTEKHRHHIIPPYVESSKTEQTKQNRKSFIYRENKLMVARREGVRQKGYKK